MVYLAIGGKLCGILCIEDPLRKDADKVIAKLKDMGLNRVIMLTGDGESTAVSYTHLDVYKRQSDNNADNHSNSRQKPVFFR